MVSHGLRVPVHELEGVATQQHREDHLHLEVGGSNRGVTGSIPAEKRRKRSKKLSPRRRLNSSPRKARAAMRTSLDYNPVHTDVEWCQRAQVFGTEKTVGHGMLTMSLMASVISREWYAEGAWIRRMDTKFTKPVEVGGSLRYEGTVIQVHPRAAGQSFVVVKLDARDSDGDTVAVGSAQVQVPD